MGGKRVKSTRACDRCKKKKSKCSGEQPCDRCSNDAQACAYMSEYTRGREPTIKTRLRPQVAPPQVREKTRRTVHSEGTTAEIVGLHLSDLPRYPQVKRSRHIESDSQEFVSSNGRSLYDRTLKHLIGKASRHQKSSIFMFGDPPLPEFDDPFLFLPPAETARETVGIYFDNIAATLRFLHRPTVEMWMESYNTNFMSNENWQRSIRAILLMILAAAQGHLNFSPGDEDPSTRYFQAADYQLQYETGQICLTSIQARLLQCFYLLSRSRINQCWSIFGTVVNLTLALRLNRKRTYEMGKEIDIDQMECQKRAFWSAYTLDKYLSNALGRPQMFHDEDIDQELPLSVADSDLQIASIAASLGQVDPGMQATIFQIKLSIIIGKLLKDLYGLGVLDVKTRLALTDKHQHSLEQWRQAVATLSGLDFPHEQPSSSIGPIVRNQNAALSLTYYHVAILLYRPFLLDTFSDIHFERARMKDHVQHCLDACMSIVEIVERLYENDPVFRARWFAHYCGYCAVVCIYVYVIRTYEQSPETWTNYLQAAQKCQLQIDVSAPMDSFAQRCSDVLKKLETETLECIHRKIEPSHYPLPPVLGGLDGIRNWRTDTVIDRIDRWGFSSLTGY